MYCARCKVIQPCAEVRCKDNNQHFLCGYCGVCGIRHWVRPLLGYARGAAGAAET